MICDIRQSFHTNNNVAKFVTLNFERIEPFPCYENGTKIPIHSRDCEVAKNHAMNQNMYFDVYLHIDGKVRFIAAEHIKNHVARALISLFGEVGAAIPVDVIKFDPDTCRTILRCPSKYYVKVHSSLTLCGDYQGRRCVYRIQKVSPCLISLLNNSREYKHN